MSRSSCARPGPGVGGGLPGLGRGAADERLRALPSLPRAQYRAAPRLRVLLRGRRALRRPARRLRAGDEDGRGAGGLRAPAGRARPADRRGVRAGNRRLVPPPRAVPGRSPAELDRSCSGGTASARAPGGSTRSSTLRHSMATDDIRMTTRWPEHEFSGVFAAMHEGGHALYEHDVSQTLERTPLCRGRRSRCTSRRAGCSRTSSAAATPGGAGPIRRSSASSRSSPASSSTTSPRDQRGPAVADPDRGRRGHLQPPHHPALRARAGADRRLARGRGSARGWNERMQDYLGIEVPDDAHGVLQDVHWAARDDRLLPDLRARQRDLRPDLGGACSRTCPTSTTRSAAAISRRSRDWLREQLWRHGRKFTPQEMLERVVGGGLDPEPYLAT